MITNDLLERAFKDTSVDEVLLLKYLRDHGFSDEEAKAVAKRGVETFPVIKYLMEHEFSFEEAKKISDQGVNWSAILEDLSRK